MSTPILIVARSYKEAKNVASLDFQLHLSEWKYVQKKEDIVGQEGTVIILSLPQVRYMAGELLKYIDWAVAIGRLNRATKHDLDKRKISD